MSENRYQLAERFKGKTIEIYDGRLVRVVGAATPGSVFCEPADGRGPGPFECSSAFLTEERLRDADNAAIGYGGDGFYMGEEKK